MTPRTTKGSRNRARRPGILTASAAVVVGALSACGPMQEAETAAPDEIGSLTSAIWANSPGVRATAQNLPWETVVASGATSLPAAAAYATNANGPSSLHVFFFDSNYCLRHYSGTESGGTWTQDTSVQYCDDFGVGTQPFQGAFFLFVFRNASKRAVET